MSEMRIWNRQEVPVVRTTETLPARIVRKTKALAVLGGVGVGAAGLYVTLISLLASSLAMGSFVYQQTLEWLVRVLTHPVVWTAGDLIFK